MMIPNETEKAKWNRSCNTIVTLFRTVAEVSNILNYNLDSRSFDCKSDRIIPIFVISTIKCYHHFMSYIFSLATGGLRNIYAHAIETIINKQNIHGY